MRAARRATLVFLDQLLADPEPYLTRSRLAESIPAARSRSRQLDIDYEDVLAAAIADERGVDPTGDLRSRLEAQAAWSPTARHARSGSRKRARPIPASSWTRPTTWSSEGSPNRCTRATGRRPNEPARTLDGRAPALASKRKSRDRIRRAGGWPPMRSVGGLDPPGFQACRTRLRAVRRCAGSGTSLVGAVRIQLALFSAGAVGPNSMRRAPRPRSASLRIGGGCWVADCSVWSSERVWGS